MKKLLIITALFLSNLTFSQQKKQFIIEHCIDKMTEREYFLTQKKLICANTQKTKGFTITPQFNLEDGNIVPNGFICKNANIGNCNEKDDLIFLFEDDTKLTLTSWNDFNCDGNAYFSFDKDDLNYLSTKKITDIRFSNGYSYESYTYTFKQAEKDYFINAYTNHKVIEIDCDN